MTLDLELVRLVEELIDKKVNGRVTAQGTVVSRSGSFTDPKLSVAVDWSPVALPMKAFGNVWARAGDRVGLLRVESGWVVVGSWTPPRLGEASVQTAFPTGSTTSASYGDSPGSDQVVTLTKYWDETDVSAFTVASAFCLGSAGTSLSFAVKFVELGSTFECAYYLFNTLSDHRTIVGGSDPIPNIPAGVHTVRLQWKRPGGAGTPSVNADDWCWLSAREIFPGV